MSCKNCPVIEPEDPSPTGLEYRFLRPVGFVKGLRGKTYEIKQPLVFKPHKPKGGWKVSIPMHGLYHEFTASDPFSVFTKVKNFLIINEQEFNDATIWLNLNLQWLERATEKYQYVTRDDLLKLATLND